MRRAWFCLIVVAAALLGCSDPDDEAPSDGSSAPESETFTTLDPSVSGTCEDFELSGETEGRVGFINFTGGAGCDLATAVAEDSATYVTRDDGQQSYESHGYSCAMTAGDAATYDYLCEAGEGKTIRFLVQVR